MRNFSLNPQELAALRLEHKKYKKYSAADAYRINAIILLGSNWTLEETANALLLDEETLRSYVEKYQQGGIEALLKKNYVGRPPKLGIEQMAVLEEHLRTNLYRSTKEIIYYVQEKYNVNYTSSGMAALLHELNFTYKKPKLIPAGLNEEEQAQFLKFMLDFLENKDEKEVVLFYDSAHPQCSTLSDYGWIKKGTDSVLPSYNVRGRVNVTGAIDIDSLDVVATFPAKVNSDSTVKTLQKIKNKYPAAKKIHIVLDNASSHRSKQVKQEFEKSNVNLVFLPAYSPNLNLIERLWGFLRRNVLANQHFSSFKAFKDKIISFFKGLKRKKRELSDLMTFNFQELEAYCFT